MIEPNQHERGWDFYTFDVRMYGDVLGGVYYFCY